MLQSIVSPFDSYQSRIGIKGGVLVDDKGVHDADSRISVYFDPLLLIVEVPTGSALKLGSVIIFVHFSIGVQDDIFVDAAIVVDVVGPPVGG